MKNCRGFTLIELLITIVIGSIAMMALAIPFSAERLFWNTGKRQTEAQRDAQLALRAIARKARESNTYAFTNGSTASLIFLDPNPANNSCFIGGPGFNGGQLVLRTTCDAASQVVLIDGVRSKVANFAMSQVVANKLVRVTFQVTHRLRTTDPRQETELLVTELFLRNGT